MRGMKRASRGLPARAIPSVMKVLVSKYHQGYYMRWAGLAGTSNGQLTWALAKTAEVYLTEDLHVMICMLMSCHEEQG